MLADSGCDFFTVHGEPQVMEAAVRGKGRSNLKILAATVLTSLSDPDLVEMGFSETARSLVERRIHQAVAAGCDGVVASPHVGGPGAVHRRQGLPGGDARRAPRLVGEERPGPRRHAGDARRRRLASGGGSPITAANDPREAAIRVAAEMAGVI